MPIEVLAKIEIPEQVGEVRGFPVYGENATTLNVGETFLKADLRSKGLSDAVVEEMVKHDTLKEV